VFEYIEGFYNLRRRHSTLGMALPGRVRRAARCRLARARARENVNGMLKTLRVSNINDGYYNHND